MTTKTTLNFSDFESLPTGFMRLSDFLNASRDSSLEADLPEARKRFAERRIEKNSGNETLADLRLQAGLTQSDLARRIGTSQPRLSAWEAGAERPGFDSIVKISRDLNIDYDRLIKAILNVSR